MFVVVSFSKNRSLDSNLYVSGPMSSEEKANKFAESMNSVGSAFRYVVIQLSA